MSMQARDGHRIELLAPGGSMEGIRAAVNAGADAIYAGGRMFGARAYARNPDTEELFEAIDYCHLRGVRLYLTVNTLLKEEELITQLPEYLAPIYEHGVDAVLVQDFGVFRFLKHAFPDLPLHASTQMTVASADGVKLLHQMGAERVVLSRELSLDEIRRIHAQCDMELEVFVHGALCYCYSGKCLMSSMIGGRSGNRGRCAQPCRLPYDLYLSAADARKASPASHAPVRKHGAGRRQPERTGRLADAGSGGRVNQAGENYLLSPRDICTLRLIPDLAEAGVSSLKIEGRMKSPEYAAGVTAMYRKYLDLYLEKGREGFAVDGEDELLLAELFSRGPFSDGYYRRQNGRQMMTLKEKEPPKGDSLRRIQDTSARIRSQYVEMPSRILLDASVRLHAAQEAKVTLTDHAGHRVEAAGFVPDLAKSKAADPEMIWKQMNKTGNTDFQLRDVQIDLEDGLFVPVGELNALRRQALEGMKEEILSPYRRRPASFASLPEKTGSSNVSFSLESESTEGFADGALEHSGGEAQIFPMDHSGGETQIFPMDQAEYGRISHPAVTASVWTVEQLEEVVSGKEVGGVYLDASVCTRENAAKVHESGKRAYLMLPQVWREGMARTVKERIGRSFGSFSEKLKDMLDGILVGSVDALNSLRESGLVNQGDGFEVIADASLYTWNKEARRMLHSLGFTMDTIPFELSEREWKARGLCSSECVIYGYQTLMTSAQCLVKTTTGCRKEAGIRYLKDRKGILFPVKNDCMLCTNTILNSVPLDLISLPEPVRPSGTFSVRYQFTVESRDETRAVLKGELPGQVTRGHFRKGAQ